MMRQLTANHIAANAKRWEELVQTGRNLEGRRQEGHDVDPDERTARVKGNERPLPPPTPIAPRFAPHGCCLTILVAKATKMEISPSGKAERIRCHVE